MNKVRLSVCIDCEGKFMEERAKTVHVELPFFTDADALEKALDAFYHLIFKRTDSNDEKPL